MALKAQFKAQRLHDKYGDFKLTLGSKPVGMSGGPSGWVASVRNFEKWNSALSKWSTIPARSSSMNTPSAAIGSLFEVVTSGSAITRNASGTVLKFDPATGFINEMDGGEPDYPNEKKKEPKWDVAVSTDPIPSTMFFPYGYPEGVTKFKYDEQCHSMDDDSGYQCSRDKGHWGAHGGQDNHKVTLKPEHVWDNEDSTKALSPYALHDDGRLLAKTPCQDTSPTSGAHCGLHKGHSGEHKAFLLADVKGDQLGGSWSSKPPAGMVPSANEWPYGYPKNHYSSAERCDSTGKGLYCSRPKDHYGPHAGHSAHELDQQPLEVWSFEAELESPYKLMDGDGFEDNYLVAKKVCKATSTGCCGLHEGHWGDHMAFSGANLNGHLIETWNDDKPILKETPVKKPKHLSPKLLVKEADPELEALLAEEEELALAKKENQWDDGASATWVGLPGHKMLKAGVKCKDVAPGHGYSCSLPKGHAGTHEAYHLHDLNDEMLGDPWGPEDDPENEFVKAHKALTEYTIKYKPYTDTKDYLI